MARYVILNSSNRVTNVVEWDGDVSRWNPPANHTALLRSAGGNIGDTFSGGIFTPPPAPPLPQLAQDLDALDANPAVTGPLETLVQALRRAL